MSLDPPSSTAKAALRVAATVIHVVIARAYVCVCVSVLVLVAQVSYHQDAKRELSAIYCLLKVLHVEIQEDCFFSTSLNRHEDLSET